MKRALVPIHGRGGVVAHVVIDAADAHLAKGRRWFRNPSGFSCNVKVDGKWIQLRLHRLIANAPAGTEVDHINHDQLDCRRANLRVCTRAQNAMNVRGRCSLSGHRGIRQIAPQSWHARITHNRKEIYLGAFDSLEAACAARRKAELELRGEFAPMEEVL